MTTVNPAMEEIRQAGVELINKDRDARLREADWLITQCEECSLPWLELAAAVREHICRLVQVAHGGRCFEDLADRLDVNPWDRQFFSKQVSGQLRSSTELMLDDVSRGRTEPLAAAFILRFLRDRNLLRVLAEASCGVQQACARRQQQQPLGRAIRSPMDSGYLSSGHSGADIVGVLSEQPDATLVKAVPLRAAPHSSSDVDLRKPSPTKAKKVMLTYTQDGRDTALRLTKSLKMHGFRVLLLEEQRHHRLSDPYSSVQKWFISMRYIVPVLTPEYLRATQNIVSSHGTSAHSLAKDARFVYSLMCSEMEQNGHVNHRVRAVIPDDVEERVREHPLYGSPMFRFPFLASEEEVMFECMEE